VLGIGELCTGFWWGNLRERDHFEDVDIEGNTILIWICKKWFRRHGLGRSGSGQGQVAGCCECGNEPSGYNRLIINNGSQKTQLYL
jgi:hypothetical protein